MKTFLFYEQKTIDKTLLIVFCPLQTRKTKFYEQKTIDKTPKNMFCPPQERQFPFYEQKTIDKTPKNMFCPPQERQFPSYEQKTIDKTHLKNARRRRGKNSFAIDKCAPQAKFFSNINVLECIFTSKINVFQLFLWSKSPKISP